MNIAQYNNSLRKAASFLRRNAISKNSYLNHSMGASEKTNLRIEDRGFVSVYKEIIEKCDYDILLFDDGIFIFDYIIIPGNTNKIRYIYFHSPYDFPTYVDYLTSQGLDHKIFGESFREEYEQELSEASLKKGQVYLRYEFSVNEYKPGIHPASHIHIGPNTEIRLSVSKIITPMAFIMFTLKQVYFDRWVNWIKKKDFRDSYLACKRSCLGVPEAFFSRNDQYELYFV